jgi:hypothetical protein
LWRSNENEVNYGQRYVDSSRCGYSRGLLPCHPDLSDEEIEKEIVKKIATLKP